MLGTADDSERARLAAKEDRLTEAMVRPHDKQAVQWQVERLRAMAGRAAVSAEERRRQAAQTLRWIAELSAEPHPVYNLRQAEGSAMAVLHSPELGAQAVAVLEQMGTPASQRALVDLASRRPSRWLRKVAVAAFVTSIQKHGVLLTTNEILAQYDRYNKSATADAETQHILGRILDTLEAPRQGQSRPEKKKRDGAKWPRSGELSAIHVTVAGPSVPHESTSAAPHAPHTEPTHRPADPRG